MDYTKNIRAIHPGEFLKEFLNDYGLTSSRLAKHLGVPPVRISEIVRKQRGVSVDTARRLSLYFGNRADFWLDIQRKYDFKKHLETVKDEDYHIQPAKQPTQVIG